VVVDRHNRMKGYCPSNIQELKRKLKNTVM